MTGRANPARKHQTAVRSLQWARQRWFGLTVATFVLCSAILIRNIPSLKSWWASNPDRDLAEFVLFRNGSLRVAGQSTEITRGKRLPFGRFDLESISLPNAGVTDRELQRLSGRKDIRSLDLSINPLTDDAARVLSGLRQLRSLDLTRTHLTQQGVHYLRRQLPDCHIIHNASANLAQWALATKAAKLIEVEVQLSPQGTRGRRRCNSLQELPTQPILQVIDADFSASPFLNDERMRYFVGVEGLDSLNISNTPISDKSLATLLQLKSLRRINVRDTSLTEDGVRQLQTALPLVVLDRG